MRNSAAKSHGGAVGGSVFFQGGFAGVSLDDYRTNYGTTAEADVTIRMQRQRLATAGEWATADGPIHRVSWQLSRNRYEHQEGGRWRRDRHTPSRAPAPMAGWRWSTRPSTPAGAPSRAWSACRPSC